MKKYLQIYCIVITLIISTTSCYIKKDTMFNIKYLQNTLTFDVKGSANAGTLNYFLATSGETYSITFPEQSLPDFNLKKELKKAGIDTVDIDKSISVLEIDSLWLEIDPSSLQTAGADFHYFNSLVFKINSKILGSYTSADTPPKADKQILFSKGDNIRTELLSGKPLKISPSGVGNSVPEKDFKVRLGLRLRIVIIVPINTF